MTNNRKTKGAAPRVTVRNLTGRRIPSRRAIRGIVKRIFELERIRPSGLSVTYVRDARIRRLNLEYRGSDRPTDVLAFSVTEGQNIEGGDGYLGDIVISVDAARRQARRFGSTKKRELKLYLIHGLLHLLGYDDEKGRKALRRMRNRETYLLEKV